MTQEATVIDSAKEINVKTQFHTPLKSDKYLSPLFSPQTVGSVISESSPKNKNRIYATEITGKILLLH